SATEGGAPRSSVFGGAGGASVAMIGECLSGGAPIPGARPAAATTTTPLTTPNPIHFKSAAFAAVFAAVAVAAAVAVVEAPATPAPIPSAASVFPRSSREG